MKTISQAQTKAADLPKETNYTIETTFVLFFLAIEFGQSIFAFRLDNLLLLLTLTAVAILPYFFPADEKPQFSRWILGRSLIIAFAVLLGWMFKQTLGVVLPDTFRFLPMTLLIVTAMLTCYIQFYSLLKLREVK